MKSYIFEYKREDNEIQKVQVVCLDSFDDLDFFKPEISKEALKHVAFIYRDFFIKKAPLLFGKLYVFHVPEGVKLPFILKKGEDRQIATKNYLKKNVKTKRAQELLNELDKRGYLYIVEGRNKFIKTYIPYKSIGFLSKQKAKLLVNSNFFTFDLFDTDSKYDCFGTPIGLCVKNGKILNPPLFDREAYFVDEKDNAYISKISLKNLKISIKGKIYERPIYRNTPINKGYDVVIINDKIVDIKKAGMTRIPSSGFVINTNDKHSIGELVTYEGLENIKFAVQCGNSIIVDGVKTKDFISSFWKMFKFNSIQYPPSQYPHDFNKDRAPRIALGVNKDNKPVIIWAEGQSKYIHIKGEDSPGVSLKEMGDILDDLEIKNAINLDGGGSAQILLNGKRSLKISDRDFTNNKESERPVPIGLIVK